MPDPADTRREDDLPDMNEVHALRRLLTYADKVAAEQRLWLTKQLVGAAIESLEGIGSEAPRSPPEASECADA